MSEVKKELEKLKLKYARISSKYESLRKKTNDDVRSRLKCYKCDKEFSRVKEQRVHIQKHKDSMDEFKCKECDRFL